MVESANRAKLQQELLETGNEILSQASTMPLVQENAATGRKVYVKWIDGCPVMVNILSIDGVTPAEYKEFLAPAKVVENLRKMSPPNA